MRIYLVALLCLSCAGLYAQLSTYYTHQDFDFELAQTHYQKEAYPGSQYDFQKIQYFDTQLGEKQKQWAELYAINVALLYSDANAIEAFSHFQEKYPENPMKKQLYYGAGQYYLQKGNTEKALQYLSKADTQGFSHEKKNHHHFTLGYIYFQENEFSKSKSHLSKVSDTEPFLAPKNYMLGHIAYTDKNYNQARKEFEKIATIPEYQNLIKPYEVQMSFNEGNYQQSSLEAKELLQSGSYPYLEIELSKIAGESEFRLGNYAQAIPYLETYIQETQTPSLPDYYQLGYAYYSNGNYVKAIEYFNQITQENSALAQNAFYQLGNSYLKNNQKKEALSAFKSASEMKYDPKIKENALYQYALISYDIGNPYQAASEAIQLYLQTYPNSSRREPMESLLVSSFMLGKNYKGALESLSKMPNKSQKLKDTEQILALMQGMDSYNAQNYKEAISYFQRVQTHNNGSEYYAKALYWEGISEYQLGEYTKALQSFKKLETTSNSITEKQQLPYDIAYCYLKLEKYQEANNYFQQYLKNPKEEYKADSQLRLADSYFGNNEVDQAIETYKEIEASGDFEQDFAAFQKAKLYGFKNQYPEQIQALNDFLRGYPDSSYREEAYYELGLAYQKTGEFLQSIVAFDKVLTTKQSTELTALAMIGKGNDYAALKEYQRALNTYKDVAQTFRNSDYAKQAVLASKAVFIEQGNMSGYQKFAQENGINLSQEESEELQFLEAQKWYFEKDYTKAIPSLKAFLNTYPSSSRSLNVQYYLGDSYYKTEKDSEAVQYLEPIAQKQNEYQEDALFALGRIYIDQQKDEKAQFAYEALYKVTQNQNYKNVCEVELMYLYDESEEADKALEMAEKVLTNNKNSVAIMEQAKLIIARSSLQSNPSQSKTQFAALENAQNAEVQAEALYHKAYFLHQDKKYENSNTVIFDLSSNLSDQQYWGAKSLVLMAKNYVQLKDNYQASYLVEEVLKNYQEFPDVIQEAKTVQSQLKK